MTGLSPQAFNENKTQRRLMLMNDKETSFFTIITCFYLVVNIREIIVFMDDTHTILNVRVHIIPY